MTALGRSRLLRAFLVLALLGVGAGVAGVYYLNVNAGGKGVDGSGSPEDEGEEKDKPIPVRVTEARTGTVTTYLSVTANLVPENEVAIFAEAEGRVGRLLVEEGDPVGKNQLLATLARDESEIRFRKAEVKAANSRSAFERATRMSSEELISTEEFDKIAMDHRVAQQELAEARWNLERTEIRAPFGGRVTRRNVTVGKHVRRGDELFTVTDFEPLIARVHLPERDVLALDEGRPVDITLKADEGVRFAGRIRQISPVVDPATGTVKVTVEAIDPPGAVRPGGFVTIDIVRETREGTVVLPREAVIRELKDVHVFVVRDALAEKRNVDVGLEEREQLEIRSGLEPGERVVVAGQGALKDGSAIEILPEEDSETRAAGSDEVARRG